MGTTTNHVCSENFKQMLISRSAFQTHVSLDKSKGNKIIKSNTVITIKQYANYALKISV
jgi:hypothetical protein